MVCKLFYLKVSVISFIVSIYYRPLRLRIFTIRGLILFLLIKQFILIIVHLLLVLLSLSRLIFISLLLLQRIFFLTKCHYLEQVNDEKNVTLKNENVCTRLPVDWNKHWARKSFAPYF